MLDSLAGIVLHFLLGPSTGFLAIRIPGIKGSCIKARLLPPHCGHCKTLFYRDPRAMWEDCVAGNISSLTPSFSVTCF